jgi:hypothetical protein
MTPKQKSIYNLVKRYGKISGMTAEEVGKNSGYSHKKAEKWAKPALKELVKKKIIRREDDKYFPIIAQDV